MLFVLSDLYVLQPLIVMILDRYKVESTNSTGCISGFRRVNGLEIVVTTCFDEYPQSILLSSIEDYLGQILGTKTGFL